MKTFIKWDKIILLFFITVINYGQNGTVTDFDGNVYNTVTIGDQIWLQENLQSLHYADGTPIIEVWAYDDNEANVSVYGRLYTWDGAMNYSTENATQGACPDGWHVPTDAEWTQLGDHLGGNTVAGGKMKSIGTEYWQSPNTGATNESGFTALPAGEWDATNNYWLMGQYAVIWSSTETSGTYAKYRYLAYNDAELHPHNYLKNFRYSVRCIKDTNIGVEENEDESDLLKTFPNPATDILYIQLGKQMENPTELNCYSLSGKLLKTYRIDLYNTALDIADLPNGIILIKVVGKDVITTRKLIKF